MAKAGKMEAHKAASVKIRDNLDRPLEKTHKRFSNEPNFSSKEEQEKVANATIDKPMKKQTKPEVKKQLDDREDTS